MNINPLSLKPATAFFSLHVTGSEPKRPCLLEIRSLEAGDQEQGMSSSDIRCALSQGERCGHSRPLPTQRMQVQKTLALAAQEFRRRSDFPQTSHSIAPEQAESNPREQVTSVRLGTLAYWAKIRQAVPTGWLRETGTRTGQD